MQRIETQVVSGQSFPFTVGVLSGLLSRILESKVESDSLAIKGFDRLDQERLYLHLQKLARSFYQ